MKHADNSKRLAWSNQSRAHSYTLSKPRILEREAYELKIFTPTQLRQLLEIDYPGTSWVSTEVSRYLRDLRLQGKVVTRPGNDGRVREYKWVGNTEPEKPKLARRMLAETTDETMRYLDAHKSEMEEWLRNNPEPAPRSP